MTLDHLADLALGIVLLAWICVRQLRWTPVEPRRLWTLPLVLGLAGLAELARSAQAPVTATEVALLAVEAGAAIGTGALMGRITVFRPLSDAERAAARPSRAGVPPVLACRTGWAGVALWGLLLAVRIAVAVSAAGLGAAALDSAGVILLAVALNRAARTTVVLARTGAHEVPGAATMDR